MRFFRIPNFTGIESHRDDADRGSLRAVEGCLPHGPGGVRSAPVWDEVGTVDVFSGTEYNQISTCKDENGNSLIFNSRNGEVTDIAVLSEANTDIGTFGSCTSLSISTVHNEETGAFGKLGNRVYAIGDGTNEAIYVGKGPPVQQLGSTSIYPDEVIYRMEYSRFPKCKFYVQGPNKTIFAAGNPEKPLRIYVSEPAGMTNRFVDTPYSTEDSPPSNNEGLLSTVDLLSSNAKEITALSTNGNQVMVHTDAGCHVLYAPTSDQANTGFRVEQAPSSVFSAAVTSRVVSSDNGSMIFWLGHDGQIYKDEAASRGSEDAKKFADPEQASWKSKGLWEKHQLADLSRSFAFYCPQSGYYWVFFRAKGSFGGVVSVEKPENGPSNLNATKQVAVPSVGPTSLNATKQVEAPSVGPTNLNATKVVYIPSVGPKDLDVLSDFIPETNPVFSSLTRWGYSAQTIAGNLRESSQDFGGSFKDILGNYITQADTPVSPHLWDADGSGTSINMDPSPSASPQINAPTLHADSAYNYVEFESGDGEGEFMFLERFKSLPQKGSFFGVLSSQSLTSGYIMSFSNHSSKTEGQLMFKIENGTDLIAQMYSGDTDALKTATLLNVLTNTGSTIDRFLFRFSWEYNSAGGSAELSLNGGQHIATFEITDDGSLYDSDSFSSNYHPDMWGGGYPDQNSINPTLGTNYRRPSVKADLRIHQISLLVENATYNLELPENSKYEGFLACKWGLQNKLPANHLYKNQCPDNSARFPEPPSVGPNNISAAQIFSPGVPTSLTSQLTPDIPGVPTGLTSIQTPGAPQFLGSSVTPDIPGVPTSLTSSYTIEAPGVPETLTSSLTPDIPGVPTVLTSSLTPSLPGIPSSLTSSLTPDAPGVPTNLTSSIGVALPGTPTNLTSSLGLLDITFTGDAALWEDERKAQWYGAAEKLRKVVTDNITIALEVNLNYSSDGTGGGLASAGPDTFTTNGLNGSYGLITSGRILVDEADQDRLDAIAHFSATGGTQKIPGTNIYKTGHYYLALHEMLHVLGVGTLWNNETMMNAHPGKYDLIEYKAGATYDPGTWGIWPGAWQYYGENALAKYREIVGEDGLNQEDTYNNTTGSQAEHDSVPLETRPSTVKAGHLYLHGGDPNDLEGATDIGSDINLNTGSNLYYTTSYKKVQYQHSTANYQPMFDGEIMTPTLKVIEDGNGNPQEVQAKYLTSITIGMLEDLGYTVDYGEAETLPSFAFDDMTASTEAGTPSTINLCHPGSHSCPCSATD